MKENGWFSILCPGAVERLCDGAHVRMGGWRVRPDRPWEELMLYLGSLWLLVFRSMRSISVVG